MMAVRICRQRKRNLDRDVCESRHRDDLVRVVSYRGLMCNPTERMGGGKWGKDEGGRGWRGAVHGCIP